MNDRTSQPLRIVFWGTYDRDKPRTRLLMQGARASGMNVSECHRPIWKGFEDGIWSSGFTAMLRVVLRCLIAYPYLLWRYLCIPKHDVVVVAYPGLIDLFIIWPFAAFRGAPVVLDMFVPLHEMIVEDRKLLSPSSLFARLLHAMESAACHLAHRVLTDTATHARFIESFYKLNSGSVRRVFVGAEDIFHNQPETKNANFTVLFYGRCIPLHGIDVIVKAAHIVQVHDTPIIWKIIGAGQEAHKIDAMIEGLQLKNVERISKVDYRELPKLIADANVCLGIFSNGGKAQRVIPNKAFQALAAGRLLITGDTPAIRELDFNDASIRLVPCDDAQALAQMVLTCKRQAVRASDPVIIGAAEIGAQLRPVLESLRKA